MRLRFRVNYSRFHQNAIVVAAQFDLQSMGCLQKLLCLLRTLKPHA